MTFKNSFKLVMMAVHAFDLSTGRQRQADLKEARNPVGGGEALKILPCRVAESGSYRLFLLAFVLAVLSENSWSLYSAGLFLVKCVSLPTDSDFIFPSENPSGRFQF